MTREKGQGRRILAGGLIIAGLVGLFVMTFVIDRIIKSFDDRYEIVAVLPDAPLLTNGSPVWIGGKEVGSVSNIGFMPNTGDTAARVSMTLDLPRSAQQHVRADSRVRITTARLVGAKVVDIVPGTAAGRMLGEGDTLVQKDGITVAQLTATAAEVKSQLDTALVAVKTIMPLVRARMGETKRAFSNLDAAMADGQQVAASMKNGPGLTLLNDPAFSASLKRVQGHAAELPKMFATMRAQAGAPAEARAAFTQLQARADTLSLHLAHIAEMMKTPNGSLSRFQNDSALVKALRTARTDLDSLIAQTRRNPLRFVF